jgi:hypothetical protein
MRLLSLARIAIVLSVSAGAQAATVTTGWEGHAGNQDQCIDTAASAIQRTGFRVNIAQDRQAVFGWRGDDNISVRCIGDRQLAVVFIYTGDGLDNARLIDMLRDEFRRGGPGVKR